MIDGFAPQHLAREDASKVASRGVKGLFHAWLTVSVGFELEADAARQPTMEQALHATARNLGRIFERQMLWCESVEQLLAARV